MTDDMSNAACESLSLESTLGYAGASALKDQLLEQRGKSVTLDASNVEHLGAPCLQVLLSAMKTWREGGLDFEITNTSEQFEECLGRLGFPSSTFARGEDH